MTFADLAREAASTTDLQVPSYDRSQVTPGIIHFGVGGFHRAHQAMYLDRLMNDGKALDWGIRGVGVLPGDARMRDVMAAQDGLYTLMLKHPDGSVEGRVIGSILDFLFAPDDPQAVIDALADPAIRIVSLTVTEGGYNIDHVTGAFNVDNPDIQADAQDGSTPTTVFGFIVAGLRARRERGIAPFTVMSCDNIQGNGDVARSAIVTFANLVDEDLGTWISENVAFPNSMVDRITPVTTDDDRAKITDVFGVEDQWPVVCEPFVQWVLEDCFPAGRPPYDEVGVQVVDDVEPYELMKLRLLNASHQALTYFGYLSGYRYAHEVAQDPVFVEYLLSYMTNEGTPTLHDLPGVDLEDYRNTLIERFANPEVRDTLARLCMESSDRIPKWLLPVVRENLAADRPILRSAGVVASWARYAEAVDEQGEPIDVNDRLATTLTAAALRRDADPRSFIRQREVFGDLADNERFAQAYLEVLDSLHRDGAHATVEWINSQPLR